MHRKILNAVAASGTLSAGRKLGNRAEKNISFIFPVVAFLKNDKNGILGANCVTCSEKQRNIVCLVFVSS